MPFTKLKLTSNLCANFNSHNYFLFFLQQTIEQWRLVFIIAAANLGLSAVVYTIWGTSDEQPWNTDGKFVTENAEVVQELTLTAKKNKEIEIDNKSSSMIDIST